MRIAGTVKYPYGVMSPNDPSGVGLGYDTLEQAQLHADTMNNMIQLYDVANKALAKLTAERKSLGV